MTKQEELKLLIDHFKKNLADYKSEKYDESTFQKKIEILDTQIDNLIYQLYNLADEKIKIISI